MPFILNRQGHLVDQIFCKDVHESLKYVDEFFELKMTEFKMNTHLSLSTCRSIESTQSVVQKPMHTIKVGFQYISISVDIVRSHARIQRVDGVWTPPPEKSQKYRIS